MPVNLFAASLYPTGTAVGQGDFESQAERRVKLGLLVGEIVNKQKIALDKDKVAATIAQAAESYETPSEIVDWYRDNPESQRGVENKVL